MTTGVDLNLQFPAGWENARQIKYSQGFNQTAPRDFVGFGPLTEPEALSIYNFNLFHVIRSCQFEFAINGYTLVNLFFFELKRK